MMEKLIVFVFWVIFGPRLYAKSNDRVNYFVRVGNVGFILYFIIYTVLYKKSLEIYLSRYLVASKVGPVISEIGVSFLSV